MDIQSPLEDTFNTPLDLEKVFTADGLRTARVLVKLMMHNIDDKRARSMPTSQQTITNSFQISRPISGLNPTMPTALKDALTFSDSQSQTFGRMNRGTDLSADQSDSHETVEQCKEVQIATTKSASTWNNYKANFGFPAHVKLVPPSNADASLGDLYFTIRRSSHPEQDNYKQNTSFHNASSTTSPLHRFPPIHENTSASTFDGQSQEQIGVSRPEQDEIKHNSSYSAIPSLNTIRHSTGGLSFSPNLASIDRDFFNFTTMNQPKKPSALSSITNSRHPTYKSRPQNSFLTPQPNKTPRLCVQHASAMPYPQIAIKSDDREMLQVVEGLAPTTSPVSEGTAARFSLNSTSGTKQVNKSAPTKRKIVVKSEGESTKKAKLDKATKAKRTPKPKPEKKELVRISFHGRKGKLLTITKAKYQLDQAIWMRILEFCPIQFLGKARLICKEFKGMVDQFTSIYINCRKENYGYDMPPPPLGLTERQYSNLLGSKGCLEPGCTDKNASRTHWSWVKRWCASCWKSKIEREDRLIKNRGDRFTNRTTLTKLLECIPVGMHDSFMKPHDYVDVDDNRPRGAPRLYKYYLKEDVERIFREYDALDPVPHEDDPTKTAEENAAGLARYQDLLAGLDDKRAEFLAEKKARIDKHMALVQRIEAGVRKRRETNRTPYDENRNARKELFTRRAREELPDISEDFVKSTIAFKAATRVFRNGGTERGWQTLKPKIEKEWEIYRGKNKEDTSSSNLSQLEGATDMDRGSELDDAMQMDVESFDNTQAMRLGSHSNHQGDWLDIDSAQTRILQSHISQHGRAEREAHLDRRNMARLPRDMLMQSVQPHLSPFGAANPIRYGNIFQSFTPSQRMGSSIFSASMSTFPAHGLLSGPPSFSNPTYQHPMSSSQAMTSIPTGNPNGSSGGPMSIPSLLTSNSTNSQSANFS